MKLLLIPIFIAIAIAISSYHTGYVTGQEIARYSGRVAGYIGIPVLLYFTIKYTGIFIGKFFSFIAISTKKKSKSNSQKTIIKGDGNTVNNTIEDKKE